MSLYVDPSGGNPTSDLETISWNDGNLGQGATSTINTSKGMITATQVTYNGGVTTGQDSADRLYTLVTTTSGDHWTYPILITPLPGGTDPYTGNDITGNGESFVDTVTQVIHVVYDIGLCGGAGIRGYDTGGNPITTPTPVALYHELSHAYHFALNQFPFPQDVCSGSSGGDEPAAEIDENVMRNELGLCLRNVCNHDGGCGSGSNCSGMSGAPSGTTSGSSGVPSGNPSGVPSGMPSGVPSGMPSGVPSGMPSGVPSGEPPNMPSGTTNQPPSGSTPGGCFIVSAATGSAQSSEVALLQQLRHRLRAASGVCAQLIDGILREYYQFSPQIARELERDALTRMGALSVIVRPLSAWFSLAAALGLERPDSNAISVAAQDVLSACPRTVAKRVIPVLEAIRTDGPLPADVPEQLLPFVARLRDAVHLPLASWALLDSLLRAWTLTTRHLDIIDQVAQWLANAPIEAFVASIDPERLDPELAMLSGFFDFRPAARLWMGSRLASALPDASDALRRHGFIGQ